MMISAIAEEQSSDDAEKKAIKRVFETAFGVNIPAGALPGARPELAAVGPAHFPFSGARGLIGPGRRVPGDLRAASRS